MDDILKKIIIVLIIAGPIVVIALNVIKYKANGANSLKVANKAINNPEYSNEIFDKTELGAFKAREKEPKKLD